MKFQPGPLDRFQNRAVSVSADWISPRYSCRFLLASSKVYLGIHARLWPKIQAQPVEVPPAYLPVSSSEGLFSWRSSAAHQDAIGKRDRLKEAATPRLVC